MLHQILLVAAFLTFLVLGLWIKKSPSRGRFREFAISDGKRAWFPLAAGVSMTYVGGAATLNMSSIGYQYGWWGLIDPVAVLLGTVIVALFIRSYRRDMTVSVGQLLSGLDKKLSVFIGVITSLVYVLMVAAQFVALEKLIKPYFPGISEHILVTIPPLAVFLYVFLGGFRSVTKTDILQYLMILVFLILPILFVVTMTNPASSHIQPPIHTQSMSINLAILFALSVLFVPVSQDAVLRAKAAKDERAARTGFVAGGISYFVIVACSIYIGIYFASHGMELTDPETVLPHFFAEYLPILGVVSIIAVMSAIISTLDSFTLSAVVALTGDVLQSRTRLDSQDSKAPTLRISTIIVYLLAASVALFFNEILGLILTGLLLYVSVLIPIALGRWLKIGSGLLFIGGLGITVFIVVVEACAISLEPKAVIYPLIHTAYVIVIYWLHRGRGVR